MQTGAQSPSPLPRPVWPRPPPAPCSFLPRNVAIIGYARTPLTDEQLREKLAPRLAGGASEVRAFLDRCTYVSGGHGVEGGRGLGAGGNGGRWRR